MFNIDLRHLQVIRAIEKAGSMKLAAEALHVSQSALSHHVKDLERNLGTNVFDRRSKKLWLTETGYKLLNSAEIIMAELVKLENEINALKTGESGTIRISTECYTTYNWLPRLIGNFSKKYPQAQVQIIAEATRKPMHYLQNGLLDIAIVSRKNPDSSTFKYTPLFNDELVAILHHDNPLSRRKRICPDDLRQQSLIVYDSEDKDIDLLQFVLKPNNIEPLRLIKMQLTEVIIEMIKLNLGIAIMAKWLVLPLINDDLVLLPFDDAFAKRTWRLVTQKHASRLQKKFVDFAIGELSKILPH
ncbi:MAG TPA: LysR family transcriptional regulator [Puia sp.]